MQTYKIRRNSDGHMLYFDAKELKEQSYEQKDYTSLLFIEHRSLYE